MTAMVVVVDIVVVFGWLVGSLLVILAIVGGMMPCRVATM